MKEHCFFFFFMFIKLKNKIKIGSGLKFSYASLSLSPSYLMPVSFMHLYAAPAAKVVLDLTAHTPAEIKIVDEGQRCLVLTCFFHGTFNGPVKHNWYHYNKWLSTSGNGLQLIENSKILQEGNLYDFSNSPDQTSGSTRSYLTINEGKLYFF